MPTSTAETTTRASSPALSPASLTGMRSVVSGRISAGQVERDADRVRCLVDAEPLHADGAARHALLGLVQRTPERRQHIGAGAPILAHLERQLDEPRLDLGGGLGDEPVADHRQRDLAGAPRGDGDGHGVAGLIFRLVQRDLEQVRRVGRGFGIPAGIEADRGLGSRRVRARHFEPIAAPGDGYRDLARLAGVRRRWCRRRRDASP